MEYIQEKISGGDQKLARTSTKDGRGNAKGGGGGGGGVSSKAGGAKTGSSRSAPAVKKASRGAIHGGGGPAPGKKAEQAEGEEAGADFLAELRERFAVDAEELAGDSDLDLLAEETLFAVPSTPAADSGDISDHGEDEGQEAEEPAAAPAEAAAPVSASQGAGVMAAASGVGAGEGAVATEDPVSSAAGGPAATEIGGIAGGLLLEEIKTMKVREVFVVNC